MNILYASNNEYTCFLGISIYSLLKNNLGEEKIHFYILSNGIKDNNVEKLSELVQSFHQEISFIDISDLEEKIGFDINSCGYNITTFARLFIDELLPPEIEKVLYLDSDIVVNDSIAGLWNTDIDDVYLAAVPEVYMPQSKKNIIQLSKEDTYYNAGVLLINRNAWQVNDLKHKFLSYYKGMNGKLLYNDQDIINHCCKGKVQPLLPTYNLEPNVYFFSYFYMKLLNDNYFLGSKHQYKKMLEHPTIIHFLGDERPWVNGNKNPYRKIFYQYQKESGFLDINWIYGKEKYMFLYHLLNVSTKIFPPIRTLLTNIVGINKFKWFGKQ